MTDEIEPADRPRRTGPSAAASGASASGAAAASGATAAGAAASNGAFEPTASAAGATGGPPTDEAQKSGVIKTPATAPPRTPRWRHVANGAALVGFLAVGAVIVHTAPTEEEWQAPIPVSGAVGQTLTGRNIEATVRDIRVADSVTASNGWSGETSGVWVVVDASVEAVITDYGASLGTAQLKVGDTLYGASERPDQATIEGVSLSVGLEQTGPLMFEVPRDVLTSDDAREAEVQLAATSDPRTDSMIVVPVDLTAIQTQASVTTDEPVWGNG